MATVAGPATPQRPLPGAYLTTPAPQQPTIFAANAASLRQHPQPPAADDAVSSSPTQPQVSDVERAAKTINNTLALEADFPPADKTIAQGISGEYELPRNASWAPFQKLKQYDLPPRILEQANMAGLNMKVGVFGPLGHAWAILDQALYLWDYTLPNPDLIGWEESRDPITAVKLVKPKLGVFVKQIEHLIVVVTTSQMLLLGAVLKTRESQGPRTVELYNTQMSIAVRGLGVEHVEASATTGRIFFTGNQSEDIYEFLYSQDEGWFRGRTSRVCHTKSNMSFVQDNMMAVGQLLARSQSRVMINQLAIDDTRNLLYTLSNTNEIKVWLIRNDLQMALARPLGSMLQNIGAFSPRSDLLSARTVRLVSISPIPATEARLLGLMATTNTGCRLYMSVMRGYDLANAQMAPNSMQISHVRFPPKDPNVPGPASETQPSPPGQTTYGNAPANVDITSQFLTTTALSRRFPPGYFIGFLPNDAGSGKLFCSAPDAARLKVMPDTTPVNLKFVEAGAMIDLAGEVCEIALLTGDSGATVTPVGYGNELAVQFDKASSELAIVTNSYIQTVRRRRLVDVFASMLRQGSKDEEGREGDILRLIRMYGRTEVAATALAVACGQGMDVASDSKLSSITDPEVVEGARSTFVNHGGRPEYNANALPENVGSPTDYVRPSPRHEGTALYLSRLIRSMWTVRIVQKEITPEGGERTVPGLNLEKMKKIQSDLNALSDFLDSVKSSIKELSEGVGSIRSRKDEVEIRGEQAAFRGLVQLISNIVEGISFCVVLFDEDVAQILAAVGEESRSKSLTMTFQDLFVSRDGKELAKELVKAIVNRSIANGSNVDNVADALRRRCGSFCSADDVIIFKAQDSVKRASEAGSQGESGRQLLNESQRLFKKVAASLTAEQLHSATAQYASMQYWAGAIELCLTVAAQKDTARQALAWQRDGKPEGDERQKAFDARKECYDLVFSVIEALDTQTAATPEKVDGQTTLAIKRRTEAYDVVNKSDDAVFQTCLYEWYVSIGQADRLLEIDSRYVTDYLQRKSSEDRVHADLLWKYYAHRNDYLEAASVQLDLARGYFELSLEERIEYLSRARTNANTRQAALLDSRQSKQQLLRDISDLLDVANIQDDLLQRMKTEPRLHGVRKTEVLEALSGSILGLDELYNTYADQAGYHDICILIYAVADHRNPVDIKTTWQNFIDSLSAEMQAVYSRHALSWESLGVKIRELGRRLEGSDAFFPIHEIVPMLERYTIAPSQTAAKPSPEWVLDIFLDIEVPHETLLPIFEQLYYSHEAPFDTPSRRRVLAGQIIELLDRWLRDSERKGERVVFGNEESASTVQDVVSSLLREDLDGEARRKGERMVGYVEKALR